MSRRWIGWLIAAIAVVAMVGYLVTQRDVLDALRGISPMSAVLLVIVAVCGLAVQAMQYRVAVGIQRIDMSVSESTALSAANAMANYYLPVRGGMVVRAAYMKRVYRFPLAQYGALTVSITGLTVVVSAAFGLVGATLLGVSGSAVNGKALVAFLAIGGGVLAAMAAAVVLADRIDGDGRVAGAVEGFRSGMSLWIRARRDLAIFLFWTMSIFAVQGLRLWLAFQAIGVSADIAEMMVIQGMAGVAFVLALTPGNIGVKEGAVVFSAALLGIDPDLALLGSLVDRAAVLLVTFGVGLASARYLARRMADGQPDGEAPSP